MTQELDETTQVAGFAPRSPWEAISTPSSPPALGFSRTGSDPQSADVQLAPEVEVGNVEYKLKLLSPTVRCIPLARVNVSCEISGTQFVAGKIHALGHSTQVEITRWLRTSTLRDRSV